MGSSQAISTIITPQPRPFSSSVENLGRHAVPSGFDLGRKKISVSGLYGRKTHLLGAGYARYPPKTEGSSLVKKIPRDQRWII